MAITPYHRLRPGLLTKLFATLNQYLLVPTKKQASTDGSNNNNRASQIQSAVLFIWGTLLAKSSSTAAGPLLEVSFVFDEKASFNILCGVPFVRREIFERFEFTDRRVGSRGGCSEVLE